MKTLRLTTSVDDIKTAARLLQSGELVVFPTETVYGLGAAADSSEAVSRIFAAKGRPADNPLIVHVASPAMAEGYAANLSSIERALLARFAPGPLTVIVDRPRGVADAAAAGHDTLGLRIPRHPAALELIEALGAGVAAPSANRSGRPSPTDFSMAIAEMEGRVAAIMDGGPSRKGLESTIVRHAREALYILRPGSITPDQLAECAAEVDPELQIIVGGTPALTGEGGTAEEAGLPASPGTRYRHYAPSARIRLFINSDELDLLLAEGTGPEREIILPEGWNLPGSLASDVIRIGSLEDYAHRLYRIFADADRRKVAELLCWLPAESTATHALRDRLVRAARG
jgi:L-threonylcarbamoyladenylate synthase